MCSSQQNRSDICCCGNFLRSDKIHDGLKIILTVQRIVWKAKVSPSSLPSLPQQPGILSRATKQGYQLPRHFSAVATLNHRHESIALDYKPAALSTERIHSHTSFCLIHVLYWLYQQVLSILPSKYISSLSTSLHPPWRYCHWQSALTGLPSSTPLSFLSFVLIAPINISSKHKLMVPGFKVFNGFPPK